MLMNPLLNLLVLVKPKVLKPKKPLEIPMKPMKKKVRMLLMKSENNHSLNLKKNIHLKKVLEKKKKKKKKTLVNT
jgi:hypothetical protein